MKRHAKTLLLAIALLGLTVASAVAATPGTMTWGVHVTVSPQWFDPGEAAGLATPYLVLYAGTTWLGTFA